MTLATPAAAGGACGGEYAVAPGGTLSKIAARCGSTIEALMRSNPRITSPAVIAVDWRISIPGPAGATPSAAADRPVALSGASSTAAAAQ